VSFKKISRTKDDEEVSSQGQKNILNEKCGEKSVSMLK